MATLNLNKAEFLKSAVSPSGFLAADLPCIVFAGKSNVGKSSVINRLLNRKNFARVGSQPGKTVHVNYFCIDGRAYFVDLPGYGYASVAKTERARWGKLMEDFFADPARITLGVMIVDARHKPTADDETMAAWFHSTGCPMVVVANKCDKLKKSEIEPNLARIRATLLLPDNAVLLPFSAEKGTGREALLGEIFHAVG
ncbi:MAG TPA: ribosome biogenesis GTP-binding protein YihA/YsxC [Clostridiales bacterium]|nr:ribosome biogenesis GTP-binding protein YihA/YsxC [Clostridiales bacterium]